MEPYAVKSLADFGEDYVKQWKDRKIATPSDFRPQTDAAADAQYYLNWCQYVYALYCNNYTLVTPGGYMPSISSSSLEELRLYGRGQQPVLKYQNQIDVSNIKGENNSKVGLLNISWRTTQVFQKLREIIIDRLMSVEYEPNIVALDMPSIKRKKMAYDRDKLATAAQSKAAFAALGKTPSQLSPEVLEMGPTDVDVMNQMGGYKTAAEIAFQEAALACLQFSDFDPEIRRQILEDLVDAGHMATHIRYDKASGQQVVEYVDLKGLICPRSEYDDCRDMHFAGMLKTRSVSWLRQYSGLGEDQLLDVAMKYRNSGANGQFAVDLNGYEQFSRGNYTQRYQGSYPYDQFQVKVMTLYFIGADVERYVMGHRPEGNMIFTKVNPNSTLNRSDERRGKEVVDNIVQYVYKVEWIVGTNYIFNYGVNDVVPRDGSPGAMRAKLPIAVYRCNKGSITDACIGAIDDLQLALYRRRHVLTVMPPPPNLSIDVSLMQQGLDLGNLKLSPLDQTEIYSTIGYYYYASKSEFALPNEGSNRPPITALPDTTSAYLAMLGQEILNSIQMLREISGVNEMVDGTGNAKDVLNKVAAGYETASNRSISGLYTAQQSHYKSMVKLIVKGLQCRLAYGDMKLNYLPIGSEVVRIIELYPEYSLHDFDISVIPGVDGTSRQMLIQALVSNRDQQKIDEATYFNVLLLIQQGQVRRAQFVMAKAVANMEAAKQKHDLDIIKQQSAAQGEQARVTEEAKQKTLELEGQMKIQQVVAKGEQDRETERLKAQLAAGQQALQTQNQVPETVA